MTTPTITTLRVPIDQHDTLAGSACIISLHEDMASATSEAYMRKDTHTVWLFRGVPGVLNRSTKGAASTWDALARADEEEAARKERVAQERAECLRLLALHPDLAAGVAA